MKKAGFRRKSKIFISKRRLFWKSTFLKSDVKNFFILRDGQYLDTCVSDSTAQHFCIGLKSLNVTIIGINSFCFPESGIQIASVIL